MWLQQRRHKFLREGALELGECPSELSQNEAKDEEAKPLYFGNQ